MVEMQCIVVRKSLLNIGWPLKFLTSFLGLMHTLGGNPLWEVVTDRLLNGENSSGGCM